MRIKIIFLFSHLISTICFSQVFKTPLGRNYSFEIGESWNCVIKVDYLGNKSELKYSTQIRRDFFPTFAWEDENVLTFRVSCGSPCWFWTILDLKNSGKYRRVDYPIGISVADRVFWYQIPGDAIFSNTNLIVNYDQSVERDDVALVVENYLNNRKYIISFPGIGLGGSLKCMTSLKKTKCLNGELHTEWLVPYYGLVDKKNLNTKLIREEVTNVDVRLSVLK